MGVPVNQLQAGELMNDVQERMQEAARAVRVILPPYTGFLVLAFDFNQAERTQVEWVSNAPRDQIKKVFQHILAEWDDMTFIEKLKL